MLLEGQRICTGNQEMTSKVKAKTGTPPKKEKQICPSFPLYTIQGQAALGRVQQGFRFNLLCVGETSLGKSTLVATLFNTRPSGAQASHLCPAVGLRAETHELRESNGALTLTVVSTVGFGDQVDREDGHLPIAAYIDAQFEAFLQEELRVPRVPATRPDSRLHACLYFLAPTGHSLRALDLCALRSLGSRVNVILLISKADTLSRAELQRFKARVTAKLAAQGVQLYRFPTDDKAAARLNAAMNKQLPFALVGTTDEVRVGGRLVRGRQYCWGPVEVENEEHCDLVKLREMLVCTNMEDLREQTHSRHYELYRRHRLRELGWADAGPGSGLPCPAEAKESEARRRQFLEACRRKEAELKQAFARRVKE
ncbi:Septin-10 [Heterocephalus glaber]|uniref:Septin n=1 Tax=Heterocephalus glaber TaxID=10181 RepID=G5B4A0_HETGA|nr:Septin-10 [Heterocephalus glaber]